MLELQNYLPVVTVGVVEVLVEPEHDGRDIFRRHHLFDRDLSPSVFVRLRFHRHVDVGECGCELWSQEANKRRGIRPLRAFEGRESTAQNLEDEMCEYIRPQPLLSTPQILHTRCCDMQTHIDTQERRENGAQLSSLFVVCFSGQ